MQNVLALELADGFRISYNNEEASHALRTTTDPRGIPIAQAMGKPPGRVLDWRMLSNISSARKREWPQIKLNEFAGQALVICGGGPSIRKFENLRQIRKLKKAGAKIWAVNRTHDWLITKGIIPWAGALLDPIPHVADYIKPRSDVRYYIGSQCDRKTLDVFDKPGVEKYLFHARSAGCEEKVIPKSEMRLAVPSQTSTIGLRSIVLGQMLGFRHFHLFGFDSSYETDEGGDPICKLHAYEKPEAICDLKKVVWLGPEEPPKEHTFYTNSAMAAQANEFKNLMYVMAEGIVNKMCDPMFIYVYGDGLIPQIAADLNLHADRKRNACNATVLHS